ncbi:6-phospho-beta-glucosidase [Rhizocola hellebori]|uniref:6-phospho-beta-glucosidase n=1 Tax=Rhizocola hellebori TaxID=1392758 RepID=A0A8J3QBX0_9ACTN|nr:6-phospho-beta-glucosidase [Rhizocola hellebori]GIH07082.1 6-phospho-beta-glucosidase [Rhizocola hellebori]
MKIAVVGGGSTYTPELIDGFTRFTDLSEVVLIDPSAERLNIVGPFAKRLLGKVSWTDDLDAGLDGASIVIIQLRVGGQQARISDETFPLECGCIGQETTGAGGLAKALRTVPVVLDVAARAAQRAPGAWIINFTNPVGIVTRALLDAGHRAAGLCNVAIGFQRRFAGLLGVSPEEVTLDHVGLNHLTWERAAYVHGVDRLPELLADAAQQVQLPVEVLQRLGSVPSYYLRYFYQHDSVLAEQRKQGTRGEAVAQIEAELLRLYQDPALTSKPELLSRRGGAFYSEAAVGLISSLLNGDNAIHAVNLRNQGHLPFLADEAVIEVSCRVDRAGATALPTPPVLAPYSGLIAAVSAYEELALQASLHGGRDRVYLALLAHPLVGQHDIAERLTDRLLAANEAYLPWARK